MKKILKITLALGVLCLLVFIFLAFYFNPYKNLNKFNEAISYTLQDGYDFALNEVLSSKKETTVEPKLRLVLAGWYYVNHEWKLGYLKYLFIDTPNLYLGNSKAHWISIFPNINSYEVKIESISGNMERSFPSAELKIKPVINLNEALVKALNNGGQAFYLTTNAGKSSGREMKAAAKLYSTSFGTILEFNLKSRIYKSPPDANEIDYFQIAFDAFNGKILNNKKK